MEIGALPSGELFGSAGSYVVFIYGSKYSYLGSALPGSAWEAQRGTTNQSQ